MGRRRGRWRGFGGLETGRRERYPGVVELCLDADHVAFLFILGAQDVELRGVQRPVLKDGSVSSSGERTDRRTDCGEARAYVSASSASNTGWSQQACALQALQRGSASTGTNMAIPQPWLRQLGRTGAKDW